MLVYNDYHYTIVNNNNGLYMLKKKKKYIVLAIIFFCSGMQGTFTFDMEVFGSRALPTANLKKKALNIHAHTHIYIF